MYSRVFLPLSLFLVHLCAAEVQQCHRQDGSALPDLPCDPAANVSACCGQGYKCVNSLFCENQKGFDLLGSCTDPTWQSPACPFLELKAGNHLFNYTLNTTKCGDGTYCPNAKNETCCVNKAGVSVISFHNDHVIPTAAAALPSYYSAGGYTIPSTTPSSPATFTSAPSAIPSNSSSSSSSGLSTGAKAGIGIGAAVGAIAVLLLIFLLFRRYQRIRQQQRLDATVKKPEGMLMAPYGAEKNGMTGDYYGAQGQGKHEMPGVQSPIKHEMPNEPVRIEMDSAPSKRTSVHEMGVIP